MLNPRNKIVTFRVSAEEYRRLCEACAAQGVRSVSELARAAMQLLIAGNSVTVTLHDEVKELRTRVQYLSTELERLSRQVGREPGPAGAVSALIPE
jgi:hypothetical protein